jgi:hypothetical protein
MRRATRTRRQGLARRPTVSRRCGGPPMAKIGCSRTARRGVQFPATTEGDRGHRWNLPRELTRPCDQPSANVDRAQAASAHQQESQKRRAQTRALCQYPPPPIDDDTPKVLDYLWGRNGEQFVRRRAGDHMPTPRSPAKGSRLFGVGTSACQTCESLSMFTTRSGAAAIDCEPQQGRISVRSADQTGVPMQRSSGRRCIGRAECSPRAKSRSYK